jgi:competence protein ComEA
LCYFVSMPRPKKYRPEYLSFTKKERTGIITIGILIILFITIPFFFPFFVGHGQVDQSAFQEEIAQLDIKQQSSTENNERHVDDDNRFDPTQAQSNSSGKAELFYFDPNTVTIEGWKKLGVKEKTALMIRKYISKGGRFKKAEDISKIWGLHEDDVQRLLPYVRITSSQELPVIPTSSGMEKYHVGKPKWEAGVLDINTADTAAFIALPGIGNKLATRIVAFREKLGGFYTIEQVSETFGLADSVFQKIRSRLVITNTAVKKININTSGVDELKVHPYLRYNLANAIVQYRQQHGKFSVLSDLKKIMVFTQEIYDKVLPYLTLN